MVLGVWADEEGCVAIDCRPAVNFVHRQQETQAIRAGQEEREESPLILSSRSDIIEVGLMLEVRNL